jgi:DNA-binding NtrC family response regulator
MRSKIRSLMVSSRDVSFTAIESVLSALPVKILRARGCEQGGKLLCLPSPVHLVFTDAVLADGNWLDVLDFAQKSKQKVNVVVISPRADVRLYIEAMNHGAFDFITESSTVPEVAHVVRSAIDNACQARGEGFSLPPAFRRPDHAALTVSHTDPENAL